MIAVSSMRVRSAHGNSFVSSVSMFDDSAERISARLLFRGRKLEVLQTVVPACPLKLS
jgi:hypothetical protein